MAGSTSQFLQTIRGRVAPESKGELREMMTRWQQDLAPGATGWLGSTAGVTDDGTFFAAVRFDTEEHARANSSRPEQHQWWMETAKLFEGEVTFHDCPGAEVWRGGGSDDAGFVQVIEARVSDVDELRRLDRQWDELTRTSGFRDDVIGGINGVHDGDRTIMVVYFTSEEAARKGERAEPPAELAALREQEMALMSDVTYTDLKEPWLDSPR